MIAGSCCCCCGCCPCCPATLGVGGVGGGEEDDDDAKGAPEAVCLCPSPGEEEGVGLLRPVPAAPDGEGPVDGWGVLLAPPASGPAGSKRPMSFRSLSVFRATGVGTGEGRGWVSTVFACLLSVCVFEYESRTVG